MEKKRICQNCGKKVEIDWISCPYCSNSLDHTLDNNISNADSEDNKSNSDHYYDDIMPEINDIVRRTPGETLAKILVAAAAVLGIAFYLIITSH